MAVGESVSVEPRLLLRGISWQTYVALRELPENYHVRMTYDRGGLEIMSPSPLHERYSHLLGSFIDVWRLELDIGVMSCRTMTIRREDLERGLEPDNCYYIQNEPRVWDKSELNFSIDPPPDLAIEIDLTRSSVDKMRLYAALGVPEVWRFDGRRLQVHELASEGRYARREASIALPRFPISRAEEMLRQLGSAHETALLRSFRDWVRGSILEPGE